MNDKTPARARLVSIDARHERQRIDNYLLAALKGVPKSHIYRLLRTGQVRVNKGRIKPVYRLKAGDVVRIPPLRLEERTSPGAPGKHLVQRLQASFLYEDEDLIVLDKPSGMAVHGGSGIRHGVIEILRHCRPELDDMELVHRLDRETSGCLMISKRREVLLILQQHLKEDDIRKQYLALLQGAWRGGARTVDAPLCKNQRQSGERVVRVSPQGKAAKTVFRPREVFAGASLMEVDLRTGRMHQIRVHAAHMGRPIAGDQKYGDADFNALMKSRGLKRLFLHAASLEFFHPGLREKIRVDAPLGDELEGVLSELRRSEGRLP